MGWREPNMTTRELSRFASRISSALLGEAQLPVTTIRGAVSDSEPSRFPSCCSEMRRMRPTLAAEGGERLVGDCGVLELVQLDVMLEKVEDSLDRRGRQARIFAQIGRASCRERG